ncbi:MAG: hypothetical protein ACYTXA_02615 [Nostoc sp.]
MDTIKYILTENQMPKAWYNIQADLPQALPPVLNPVSCNIKTVDIALKN